MRSITPPSPSPWKSSASPSASPSSLSPSSSADHAPKRQKISGSKGRESSSRSCRRSLLSPSWPSFMVEAAALFGEPIRYDHLLRHRSSSLYPDLNLASISGDSSFIRRTPLVRPSSHLKLIQQLRFTEEKLQHEVAVGSNARNSSRHEATVGSNARTSLRPGGVICKEYYRWAMCSWCNLQGVL